MLEENKWYNGSYFGIPVKIMLLPNEGMEIRALNKISEKPIIWMTKFEQLLNFVCSLLSENYEPHFKAKIKIAIDND
jgi:hypothetical protein